MRDFVSTGDWSRGELEAIVDRAIASKGRRSTELAGKSVALVFFNASLRTRSSFEVGITQLGGHSSTLEAGSAVWGLEHAEGVVMDADKPEHIKDAARVLSRYFDAIAVRSFPGMKDLEADMRDPVIRAFCDYAEVPVINLESCLYHPCQAMADVMTIKERFGRTDGVRVALAWAPHVKALPTAVPSSFALAASQFGCDVTIVAPEGYTLPPEVMDRLGAVKRKHDQSVLASMDVVYPKSWGSLTNYGVPPDAALRDWIVNREKIGDAVLMHCLPVRRNLEVADDALDSPNSAIYDEAENRLHVQKEILKAVLS